VHCWIGSTNAEIHNIIRANLHRAPMYSGQIQSTGPRYCPSIEDKVVRFADKDRHQIFLEPEGLDTDEIYCNGISTSLPGDVQDKWSASSPACKTPRFCASATPSSTTWSGPRRSPARSKPSACPDYFSPARSTAPAATKKPPPRASSPASMPRAMPAEKLPISSCAAIRPTSASSIDDLVTKPPTEPYRMFTSRAEHRLHLRNDNADQRLTPIGREIGLVDDHRWSSFNRVRDAVNGETLLRKLRANEHLRRPEVTWTQAAARWPELNSIPTPIAQRLEIRCKYEGYIARQDRDIDRMAKLEPSSSPPPPTTHGSSACATKPARNCQSFTPRSLGQALRISGITPADVTVLAIHIDRR
jgi:tRNA uridine 5-carboxymethylaminomethyl modification enzyme